MLLFLGVNMAVLVVRWSGVVGKVWYTVVHKWGAGRAGRMRWFSLQYSRAEEGKGMGQS